jgi:serine/threonine protein kinase
MIEVKTNASHLSFDNYFASGGEGVLFNYKQYYLIKVFKDIIDEDKLTKEKKIDILIKHKENGYLPDGVICPTDKVNINGCFQGYMMKKVNNSKQLNEIDKISFIKKLKILSSLGKTVKKLHELDIVIGDLTPKNILVDNNYQQYIIDSDSWGVNNMTPDSYTYKFLDPIIINNKEIFKQKLLSKESDLYAYTLIAYMILTDYYPEMEHNYKKYEFNTVLNNEFYNVLFKEKRNNDIIDILDYEYQKRIKFR